MEGTSVPRVRVVFLTWALAGGGAERQLLHLLQAPWSPAIIPTLISLAPPDAYVDGFDALPVRTVMPPTPNALPLGDFLRMVQRLFGDVAAPEALLQLCAVAPLTAALQELADDTPTIVVAPLFDLLPCVILAREYLQASFPIVSIEQVHPFDFFQHDPDLSEIARAQFPVLLRAAYRHTDHLVAVSHTIRQVLMEEFGVDGGKISVIPNAVRIQRVPRAKGTSDRFTIGAMGRFDPIKRYELLLHSIRALRNLTGERISLLLLGQGPGKESLEALTRALDLDDEVVFAGFHPEPWEKLAAADVFVHTSVSEALPLAMLEAMAAHLPIVTTAWKGAKELVEDGVNGFVVADDAPETIAAAIATLMRDPELRARCGTASHRKALSFDFDHVIFPKYRAVLDAMRPHAAPIPDQPAHFAFEPWLARQREPVRFVIDDDEDPRGDGSDGMLRFAYDTPEDVPPPRGEQYLIGTWDWPEMMEIWRRSGEGAAMTRAALLMD